MLLNPAVQAFENVEAARQKLVQNNMTSGKLAESAALLEEDVKRVEALAEQRKRGAVLAVSERERALQVAEADNRVAQKQVPLYVRMPLNDQWR